MRISHRDSTAVTKLIDWLQLKYDTDEGTMRVVRCRSHNFLGVHFEYLPGKMEVSMTDYAKDIITDFPDSAYAVPINK